MEPYVWKRLPDNRSIRLLHLRGYGDKEQIKCFLNVATIDDPPTYAAISYYWGEGLLSHSLDCAGKLLKVTERVYSLMTHIIKRNDCPRILWLDAICIDQEDLNERASQLLLMKSIFSKASLTIIYLGEPENLDNVPATLDLGNKIIEMTKRVSPRRITADRLQEYGLPPIEDISWLGLAKLFCNPWFERAWVLQEYVLSDYIVFLYGGHWAACDYLVLVNETLVHKQDSYYLEELLRPLVGNPMVNFWENNSSNLSGGISTKLSWMESLRQMRKRKADYQSWGLRMLQNRTFAPKTTEPRDYIYGMLGILPENAVAHPYLQPNYHLSVPAVYTRLARFLLETKGLENVLYSAGFPRSAITEPSWVPDWSTQKLATTVRQRAIRGEYTAGGPGTKAEWRFREDVLNKIFVCGIVFDVVVAVESLLREATVRAPRSTITKGELRRNFLFNTMVLIRKSTRENECTTDLALRHIRTLCLDSPIGEPYLQPSELPSAAEKVAPFYGNPETLLKNTDLQREIMEYLMRVYLCDMHTGFCLTGSGCVGRVPYEAVVGDKICFFQGVGIPFIIRETGANTNEYSLIDSCYVHGKMHGEVWDEDGIQLQEICLV